MAELSFARDAMVTGIGLVSCLGEGLDAHRAALDAPGGFQPVVDSASFSPFPVHPIVALETEYSLWSRDVESEILPACRELGIGLMAYSPLGRGFLTASIKTLDALLPQDRRRDHPRFNADNIERNARLLEPLERVAAAKGCTPGQVALAWVLAQGADIVPIPGTKRRRFLEQNCAAAELVLSAQEIELLSRAFPLDVAAGKRYPDKQLAGLGL